MLKLREGILLEDSKLRRWHMSVLTITGWSEILLYKIH